MSTGNYNPIENEHVRERLSDYMDSLLPSDEHEVVRAHLEVCVDCRADYADLRATQKLLQIMPAMAAPRSFTLTPEMAGQGRKASLWERLFAPRNAPRLATGSLVAFLLLFLFVVGDFQGQSNAALPSVMKTASNSAPDTSSAETQPAAPGSDFSGAAGAAAPTSTTAVAGLGAALPPVPTPDQRLGNTPDTEDSDTGTGSPTTTTLSIAPEPPSGDGTISSDRLYTSSAPSAENPAPTSVAPGDNHTGWVVLQLGLLMLGLVLGVSAFISSRRT